MSLSLLIVEDEAIIADDLSLSLEDLGYQVCGIASNYEESIEILQQEKPDMVLLDIMLKGEKSGIDVAHYIQNNLSIPFVFLTSLYDNATVSKAEKTTPMGYLVKPFKEADLQVTLQMAWKKHKAKQVEPKQNQKIFVRHNGTMIPLTPQDIYYVEASDNYSIFYTSDRQYVVSQTLKKIEDQLLGTDFCRIHKTYLVNLSRIELIEQTVVFINGKPIPIGKVYKKDLMERLTIF